MHDPGGVQKTTAWNGMPLGISARSEGWHWLAAPGGRKVPHYWRPAHGWERPGGKHWTPAAMLRAGWTYLCECPVP